MLRILGSAHRPCDGVSRREALRVGGLSLFSGVTLPHVLRAREAQAGGGSDAGNASDPGSTKRKSPGEARPAAAKSVILLNLLGGPPHQDLFDLKPEAPVQVRGEFNPIDTSVPGLRIGELLPLTARVMDRCTLIRTYSHRYNSHNPYNVYTGFDLGSDRDNYFAKPSDHPSMASVCQYFGIRETEVPPYVILPAFPGHSQSLRRAGPYGGYLGARFDPLFSIWDKKFSGTGKFYEPVQALGTPVLPSLDALPDIAANRLDHRQTLLQQLDRRVAELERTAAVTSMGHFQRKVFSLLTSSKTREAFDLTREPPETLARYGETVWGKSLAICRRLVEAGSMFVSVNWEEADSGNHWDMHDKNFSMCRVLVPTLDRVVSTLILDLEERGLLEQTLVVVMGEMGRTPKVNARAGRDHWPQCGFVLLAGGGTKRGCVLGKTDAQAAYPTDRPVSAGDLVATIYQLLGVDPESTVPDRTGRPIYIAHGGEPAWEVIA